MMRNIACSIVLLAALLVGAVRVSGEITWYTDFESGSDLNVATTNLLASSTKNTGPGYWTMVNFTDGNSTVTNMFFKSPNNGPSLLRPIVLNGTTNAAPSDSRSMRTMFNVNKRRWAQYNFNTNNVRKLTYGFYVRLSSGWNASIFDSLDFCYVDIGGFYSVLNWWDNNGPGPFWQIHSQSQKGSDLTVTNTFDTPRNKWCWICVRVDLTDGSTGRTEAWVYDPNTWQRYGTSTLAIGDPNAPTTSRLNYFAIGQYEPHSGTWANTEYFDIDSLVMDIGGSRWPIFPGTTLSVAKSGSSTDVSAAITAAATDETVVIPSGSNQWSSTLTVNKRIILSGLGTNSNPTCITNTSGADTTPTISLGARGMTLSNMMLFGTGTTDLKGYGIQTTTNDVKISHVNLRDFESATECNGYGVIHYFTMQNCLRYGRVFGYIGGGTQVRSEQYPIPYTSTNYMFFEDGGIETQSSFADITAANTSIFSGQEGMSYVVRFVNIKVAKLNIAPFFDSHGNDPTQATLRSSCGGHIYKVTMTITGTAQNNGKIYDIRGGRWLCYSNTCTGFATATNGAVTLREEDVDAMTTIAETVDGTYLFQLFGGTAGTVALPPTVAATHQPYIALNNQYFVSAPAGSYDTWSPPYPYGSAAVSGGGGGPPSGTPGSRVRVRAVKTQ